MSSIKAMSELVQAAGEATRDIMTNAHMLHYQGRVMSPEDRELAWQDMRHSLRWLTAAFEEACPKQDEQPAVTTKINLADAEPF